MAGRGHVCQSLKHVESRPSGPGRTEWGSVGGEWGRESVRDGKMAGMRWERAARL